MLDRVLEKLRIHRRVGVLIPGFLGVATVIGATDYLCTLPRRAAEAMAACGRVKVLQLPFNVPGYPVKLHWHARQAQDPANRWLRGVLAEMYAPTRARAAAARAGR